MAKIDKVEEMVEVEETVEVAPAQDELVEGLDDNLDDLSGEATLTSLPLITIGQAMSPDVQSGEIPGLKVGSLMNTLTKEVYGNEVEVIVYRSWKSRAIMPPREEGSYPICFTMNDVEGIHKDEGVKKCEGCPMKGYGSDSCRDQYWFLVAPKDNPTELLRINMWKSSRPAGIELINLMMAEIRKHSNPALKDKAIRGRYELTFKIESRKVTKNGNTYYVFAPKKGELLDKEFATNSVRPSFVEATRLVNNAKANFEESLTRARNAEHEADEFAEGLQIDEPSVATTAGDDLM